MATPLGGIDHLLKELFCTTGAKAFPESGHAAGIDRKLVLKILKTAKELPVGILQKAIQNRFVAFIEGIFQIVQANHQPGWTAWSASLVVIGLAKDFIENGPVNLVGQNIKLMRMIEYLIQSGAEEIGRFEVLFGLHKSPDFEVLFSVSGNL